TWKRGHATWQAAYEARGVLLPDPQEEWHKLVRRDIQLVLLGDDEYPPLLREIASPPHGIYVLGAPVLGAVPSTAHAPAHSLAIVGTRRATPEGKQLARQFGRELARAGC